MTAPVPNLTPDGAASAQDPPGPGGDGETADRFRRQTLLLELLDRLRSLTDPRAVMATAVEALGQHLGANRVGYGLINPGGDTVVLETCYANGVQPLTGTFALADFGAGNIARQRQGETVVVSDVTADPTQMQATFSTLQTRAFVSVPLIRDGQFRAWLYVNDREPRHWSAEDVALIEDVAARTWDTLERARAEAALRQSERQLRFLNALSERTRDLLDPEQVMATMARALGEHLCVSRCAYADVESDSERFTIRHDYIDGCSSTTGDYHLSLFGPRAAADQRAGKMLVIHDVDAELPSSEGAEMFNAIAVKAIICCPLVRGGRLVAMMAVHQTAPRRWTPEEIELVEAVVERSWAYIERARAARALAQSERAFRQLADAMPQIVWAAGPDGVLDYYNRRWFEYVNLPPDAIEAATWDRYIHPDDLARVYQTWSAALQSGQTYATEFRVRGADGVYRWFLVRALAVRDTAGNVVRWNGTCTDIEDRKRLEARDQFLLMLDAVVRPLTDPAEITAAHARLLGEHLTVDRCAYADVEQDQDTFNLTGDYNRGVPSIVGRYRFADFGEEVLRLMRADKPYVANDVDIYQPPIGDLSAYRATMIRAVICVPLHKDGRFVAAMAVHQKVPRVWSVDEVDLVRSLAARCWESIERARVERTLRQSEERLRLATDTAELGIWVWHVAEDRFTWENERLYEMLSLPRSGEPINAARFTRDFVHPDDAGLFQRAIADSLQQGARFYFQGRFHRGDGELRWVEFTGHLVRAADGSPMQVLGTAADVTDRKRAEQALQRSATEAVAAAEANAKFRAFFEQGTYFAGVMTLDGTLIEANRLFLETCGFTREQVIGKKFWECGWWNRSVALVEMVKAGSEQAAAGQMFRRETTYFIADGSQRVVDLTIAPVTDDTGRVLFVAPSGVDITEKNRLADERERLLDAERASRAQAETASLAKDKFLAVLSHELRTPLSPVVMTIPAIEIDPDLPFKFREDLAMVRRNIDLEVKLIDDLLDLSRVTSGKLRLQMQSVRVHELLRHAMQSSMSETAGKQLRIHQELGAQNDLVTADPARLQQVFWNLLRNAVKFTPEGGQVTVHTRNIPGSEGGNGDSKDRLCVEIRDTGIGIEPDVLPRIFDAFEQGDPQMTRQFGGLGLGLAIAKAVVEMHGGTVRATSGGKDQGAAFTVSLNIAADRPAERSDNGPPAPGADPAPLRSRILLVEDHPDSAYTLSRLLKLAGFDVKTAGSVASALQCAAVEPFDVLVSDIGLPDATGYDLMRQIKDRHGIKGIALSGYGMEEDMRKSREAGFVDHVVKPVNVALLEAVIRRVTSK